jgi:hypothetical protein
MKEDLAGKNTDWENVGHSRQDFGSSNDLGGSGLGSKLLVKGVGSNLPPRRARTRAVMTHNFAQSPLDRKGNCTKPKIGHIACRFFDKSTQGEAPFQHSRSLVMRRRQNRDAKVDQNVCMSILHPHLTRFKGHIPENLQRIFRGSPAFHPRISSSKL